MSETCANPLLLGWIKEWLDQARERNSKGVTVSVYLFHNFLLSAKLIRCQIQESL
jgi:hypothetical protein